MPTPESSPVEEASPDDLLALDTADLAAALSPGPRRRLSPMLVTLLQSARMNPSVTLLITTTPAEKLLPEDAARLRELQSAALARLTAGAEGEPTASTESLVGALDQLVRHAEAGPAERALAIFANQAVESVVPLPIEVENRAVVGSTFATRDLVRALHRTPRHIVLTLGSRRAGLLDGAGGRLAPVPGSRFPIDLQQLGTDDRTATLRHIDIALGAYTRLRPAPLIVAGPEQLVADFCTISEHTGRLAGTLTGDVEELSVEELANRTRGVLERYLRSREREALRHLAHRATAGKVASGIAEAWHAARVDVPEMLAVEEGYWCPARLSADGDLVELAEDPDAPDVVDDLVDELIEVVLDRAGWIALVEDGSLHGHRRVALTLRD